MNSANIQSYISNFEALDSRDWSTVVSKAGKSLTHMCSRTSTFCKSTRQDILCPVDLFWGRRRRVPDIEVGGVCLRYNGELVQMAEERMLEP
jgi:hypothetical protein